MRQKALLNLKLYYTQLAANQFNYLPRFHVVKRNIKLPVKVDNKLTSKKLYCHITKAPATWHDIRINQLCFVWFLKLKRLEVRYATCFFTIFFTFFLWIEGLQIFPRCLLIPCLPTSEASNSQTPVSNFFDHTVFRYSLLKKQWTPLKNTEGGHRKCPYY